MPRVLVVYDVDGWAQHRCARALKKYAPDGYDVEIRSLGGYAETTPQIRASFDAVYHLYVYSAQRLPGIRRLVASLGSHAWMHARSEPGDWRTRGANRVRNCHVGAKVLRRLTGIVCRSEELRAWAKKNSNVAVRIPVGVDFDIWTEAPCRTRKKIVVGWCGQIGGGKNGENSFKGYREILVPLMKRLGDEVEWRVNTRDYASALDTQDMVEFYHDCDVFLTTSVADGTPNPPFEAAACGVPVISTPVGAVADWRCMRDLGLLVPGYHDDATAAVTRKAFVAKVRKMAAEPEWRRECRNRLRQSLVDEYDYRFVAPRILRFAAEGVMP